MGSLLLLPKDYLHRLDVTTLFKSDYCLIQEAVERNIDREFDGTKVYSSTVVDSDRMVNSRDIVISPDGRVMANIQFKADLLLASETYEDLSYSLGYLKWLTSRSAKRGVYN